MPYFNLARPWYTSFVTIPISAGVSNSCPFCAARTRSTAEPGKTICFLNGRRSGCIGTVSPQEPLGDYEFFVRFESDPPDVLERVLIKHDLYLETPFESMPDWLPNLSIDDLAEVDEFVVRFCGSLNPHDEWAWWNSQELYSVIIMLWERRLPIRGEQVWKVCAAHGAPNRFKDRIVSGCDFGLDLLVASHGRKPIRRRAVPAMSIGRYEPKRAGANW